MPTNHFPLRTLIKKWCAVSRKTHLEPSTVKHQSVTVSKRAIWKVIIILFYIPACKFTLKYSHPPNIYRPPLTASSSPPNIAADFQVPNMFFLGCNNLYIYDSLYIYRRFQYRRFAPVPIDSGGFGGWAGGRSCTYKSFFYSGMWCSFHYWRCSGGVSGNQQWQRCPILPWCHCQLHLYRRSYLDGKDNSCGPNAAYILVKIGIIRRARTFYCAVSAHPFHWESIFYTRLYVSLSLVHAEIYNFL